MGDPERGNQNKLIPHTSWLVKSDPMVVSGPALAGSYGGCHGTLEGRETGSSPVMREDHSSTGVALFLRGLCT
jgi:hypothetical protein